MNDKLQTPQTLQLHDPQPLLSDSRPESLTEHEGTTDLSNYASSILDSDYAEGVQTAHRAVAKDGKLSREIDEGSWKFIFVDATEDQRHIYTWRLGDSGASWAKRHSESTASVRARLEDVFSQDDQDEIEPQSEQTRSRLERILATLGLAK